MDIYQRFNLPLPPPPRAFSFWSGPERARLPDLVDRRAASEFLDKLTIYQHSMAFQVQFLFGIGYLGILCAISTSIIILKLRRRAWWVFRSVTRYQGILVIPNVHNIWALGTGIYAMVCIGGYTTEFVYYKKAEPVPHLTLWINLQWTPLAFACVWQAWGIYVARAQSTSNNTSKDSSAERSSNMPMMLSRPRLTNYIWFFMPTAQFLLLLTPAILSDRYLERARHGRSAWRIKYEASADLSREMLLDLQSVWDNVMQSFYHVCISMFMWTIFTALLFVLYTSVSWRLISGLRSHLRAMRRRRPLATFNTSLSTTRRPFGVWANGDASGSPVSPDAIGSSSLIDVSTSLGKDASLLSVLGSSTPRTTQSEEGKEGRRHDIGREAAQIRSVLFTDIERQKDRSQSFFPTVTPSATLPSQPLQGDAQAQRVLRYFMIQSISVSCGILCLTAIPLFLALTLYSASENASIERFEGIGYLAASWVTFVFGGTTMVSICHATFESTFSQLLHDDGLDDTDFREMDSLARQTTTQATTLIATPQTPDSLLLNSPHLQHQQRTFDTHHTSSNTYPYRQLPRVLAPEDFSPTVRYNSERRTVSRPTSRREWVMASEQNTPSNSGTECGARKRTSFDLQDQRHSHSRKWSGGHHQSQDASSSVVAGISPTFGSPIRIP
ncbi:hypothetical protein A4X09_0g2183 [Tilletia walkeri]|uniref:Uncharacterized protein n=1 Tax=Tilletia walkeri TaxID=117179 RepID=A0A8X7T7C7_9BASI|nr:hypothetical protein A4X09_0g2183 [Tilletia walkeri]